MFTATRRALVLTLCFALGACSTAAPCSGLECIKDRQERELYRQCVNVTFREMHEEIAAGFYDAGHLAAACRQWADGMVR